MFVVSYIYQGFPVCTIVFDDAAHTKLSKGDFPDPFSPNSAHFSPRFICQARRCVFDCCNIIVHNVAQSTKNLDVAVIYRATSFIESPIIKLQTVIAVRLRGFAWHKLMMPKKITVPA